MTSHADMPLIDMCAIAYDDECWRAYLTGFADNAPSYLRTFAARLAEMAGLSTAQYLNALASSPHAAVDLVVDSGRLGIDIDIYVRSLREQGVATQVLVGGPGAVRGGGTINDRVAEHAARHDDVLVGWAAVSLGDPDTAIKELRRSVLELGLEGVAITHFMDDVDPLSAACHDWYAEAARLDVPVWIHTGHNLSSRAPMDVCTWREIDIIAGAHPALRIIAGHGGWPWMLEMVSVCQRRRNVYLELSTHRASQMRSPGSGWEPLLAYGASRIRDRVMFGSLAWVHGRTPRQLAGEFEDLGLGEQTTRRWLHDNAARFLGAPARSNLATA